MAELLKGAPVAAALTARVAERAEALLDKGVQPTLAILRVGEREDDLSYERGAIKRAEKAGEAVRRTVLPEDCSQAELMAAIDAVNADPSIHGCLMFRPLPKALDERAACEALAADKDVDGITARSLAGVFMNEPVGFAPCTAEAVLELLDFYGYDLTGANVCVVGRSTVIGKPVSMMLQARNATVTMCHTRTRDLAAACRAADVLVVAAGHIGTCGEECFHPGQTVVDVGINWDAEQGKLVGDADFSAAERIVRAVTPVPGGVGSITTAVLMKHVVEVAARCPAAR